MSDLPAWIQAGAAGVQAVAAITIYVVTRQYVALTRELAGAANEQLKLNRLSQLAEDKQRAGALRGRAAGIEARVSDLPEQPDDTAFRTRALWTADEIDGLQTAAAQVFGLAADAAGKAAVELTWLRDQIQAIRDVPINMGYDYPRSFPNEEWRTRRAAALTSLRELMQHALISADLADSQGKQLSAASALPGRSG